MAKKKTSETAASKVLPAAQLEAAFNKVVLKLKNFSKDLSADEKGAFIELLEAARAHTDFVQARDEGDADKLLYMKPVQVHATWAMKQKMKQLPDELRG